MRELSRAQEALSSASTTLDIGSRQTLERALIALADRRPARIDRGRWWDGRAWRDIENVYLPGDGPERGEAPTTGAVRASPQPEAKK